LIAEAAAEVGSAFEWLLGGACTVTPQENSVEYWVNAVDGMDGSGAGDGVVAAIEMPVRLSLNAVK
jgi:hypothetical protein